MPFTLLSRGYKQHKMEHRVSTAKPTHQQPTDTRWTEPRRNVTVAEQLESHAAKRYLKLNLEQHCLIETEIQHVKLCEKQINSILLLNNVFVTIVK